MGRRGELELQLQGLPIPAKFLTCEPLFKADNTATVLLASQPLNADLFDGVSVSGPVPLFFAADKDCALAALSTNIASTHEDIRRINLSFHTMEHV
jgi:hypothetical protein